jgi:hypothetical protein
MSWRRPDMIEKDFGSASISKIFVEFHGMQGKSTYVFPLGERRVSSFCTISRMSEK